jgi:Dehydrogenases with different specificities (related to short-chain alcohol dehydrogenases)
MGGAVLLGAARLDAALNSLSFDFIAASFALLREGGAFSEIGKRAIWAPSRHAASAAATVYCAIALDADMALEPMWMHRTLALLATRADAAVVTSLPLISFDMEVQHTRAFRTLQGGLTTGKVVIRIAARRAGSGGVHMVTGGTSGLGLLTGRWLAQRGVRQLVLASRGGMLSRGAADEWRVAQASAAMVTTAKWDASEASHTRRPCGRVPWLDGVWHAAGLLADAMLLKQDALALARAHAPKAHGACRLHATAGGASAFALFSSVAALLGGAGQANYAAANSCLDALSTCRRAQGATAASVQWGAWAEVGMAARGAASERMAAMEAASGFGRIRLAQGLAALAVAARPEGPSVLGVVPVTWSRFLDRGAAAPLLLEAFAPAARQEAAAASVVATAQGGLPLEAVLELAQRTAGGAVDADAPLMERGSTRWAQSSCATSCRALRVRVRRCRARWSLITRPRGSSRLCCSRSGRRWARQQRATVWHRAARLWVWRWTARARCCQRELRHGGRQESWRRVGATRSARCRRRGGMCIQ